MINLRIIYYQSLVRELLRVFGSITAHVNKVVIKFVVAPEGDV